jgi:hypothetical protein
MTEKARVLVTTPLPDGSETALLQAGHEIVRAPSC